MTQSLNYQPVPTYAPPINTDYDQVDYYAWVNRTNGYEVFWSAELGLWAGYAPDVMVDYLWTPNQWGVFEWYALGPRLRQPGAVKASVLGFGFLGVIALFVGVGMGNAAAGGAFFAVLLVLGLLWGVACYRFPATTGALTIAAGAYGAYSLARHAHRR